MTNKPLPEIERELTLNDVLLSLYSRYKEYPVYHIDNFGIIYKEIAKCGLIENIPVLHYDLTKSFDNQSPETKRALHKLLIK